MTNSRRKERVLIIAAGMLLLSILLMIAVIPGVFTKSLPNDYNPGAAIAISLAIILRLLIFFWHLSTIKKIRNEGDKRKRAYIVIGVLLAVFGLIYMDGAFAYLNNKHILYVSYLMFGSVFCDFIAALLTFTAAFSGSQDYRPQES
jgi:hypothetical protein